VSAWYHDVIQRNTSFSLSWLDVLGGSVCLGKELYGANLDGMNDHSPSHCRSRDLAIFSERGLSGDLVFLDTSSG